MRNGERQNPLWGRLYVLAAAIMWGTTGAAAHYAPAVSAFATGAVAMGIGGLLQAVPHISAMARSLPSLGWRQGRYLLAGGLGVFVYPLAFYGSMRCAGVAVGTVVSIGTAPLFSALLERVYDGRHLAGRWFMGAGLGVAGMGLLCLGGGGGQAVSVSSSGSPSAGPSGMFYGVLLGLLAGLTYALYTWCAQHMMRGGMPTKLVMGMIFGLGGLCLLPVLLATGRGFLHSGQTLAVGAYLALVPMYLGYVCFGRGLVSMAASTATVITLAEPMVAALLALLLLGEHFSPAGWTGLALMALSLLAMFLPLPSSRQGEAGGEQCW